VWRAMNYVMCYAAHAGAVQNDQKAFSSIERDSRCTPRCPATALSLLMLLSADNRACSSVRSGLLTVAVSSGAGSPDGSFRPIVLYRPLLSCCRALLPVVWVLLLLVDRPNATWHLLRWKLGARPKGVLHVWNLAVRQVTTTPKITVTNSSLLLSDLQQPVGLGISPHSVASNAMLSTHTLQATILSCFTACKARSASAHVPACCWRLGCDDCMHKISLAALRL